LQLFLIELLSPTAKEFKREPRKRKR